MTAAVVLVVARDDVARASLCAWTKELGLATLESKRQRVAFGMWRAARPLAVFVEHSTHGVDGKQFASRLRMAEAQLGGPRTVLIAISGFTDESDYRTFRLAGFDGVLRNPLQRVDLHARLAAIGWTAPHHALCMLVSRARADELYTEGLHDDLRALALAVAEGSVTQIRHRAHRIKGASLMFGKAAVGDAAALIEHETMLERPDPHRLATLLEELRALFATVVESVSTTHDTLLSE